jgi:hypothetical protein
VQPICMDSWHPHDRNAGKWSLQGRCQDEPKCSRSYQRQVPHSNHSTLADGHHKFVATIRGAAHLHKLLASLSYRVICSAGVLGLLSGKVVLETFMWPVACAPSVPYGCFARRIVLVVFAVCLMLVCPAVDRGTADGSTAGSAVDGDVDDRGAAVGGTVDLKPEIFEAKS